jgi:cytochrome b
MATIRVYLHDVSLMLVRVEGAHGGEGGAPGQHTWHTQCPFLINRNTTALRLQWSLTGVQDARYALYLQNMGSLLGYMQHWKKAKSVHSEALTIRTAKVGEANDTAVSQHIHLGQYDSAW